MPEKRTRERAQRAKREGKAASTQAGEFVREEMHHKQSGKHPVKNRKQAIAIGLNKARRAGVALKKPKAKSAANKTTQPKPTATRTRSSATKRRRASTAAKKPRKTTARKATATKKSA